MQTSLDRTARRWAARGVPLLILALPSLWLLLAVPPLWRDVDAYVQTVFPPGSSTILLHGPLYCAFSRLPLWLGYLASRSGPIMSLDHFIRNTQLTDEGVFSLVFCQHVALWLSALYLITAVTVSTVGRICLAGLVAIQPLFYTFAHCVGSETASMLLAFVFIAKGLRIVRDDPPARTTDWLLFAALLLLLVLTRHINGVLVALLPATALLVALRRRLHNRSATLASSHATWLFKSLGLALVALLWASTFTHLLCWQSRIKWRPQFGFTFLWRLNFLEKLEPPIRQAALNGISARCKRTDAQRLVTALDAWFETHSRWDPPEFVHTIRAELPRHQSAEAQVANDLAMNEVASRFLMPPQAALASAAAKDFATATRTTQGGIVASLFTTTDYVFSHANALPQVQRLTTFRQSRMKFLENARRPYFRWCAWLSSRELAGTAILLLGSACLLDRLKNRHNAHVMLFGLCVGAAGIAMVFLNCFLAGIQPRFVLPMSQFLFVAVLISLSIILEQKPRDGAPPIAELRK